MSVASVNLWHSSSVGPLTIFAMVVCPSVHPSVRHKPVLYRNDWTNRAVWHGGFLPTILHCLVRKLKKIRTLRSGTLYHTLDFENFATASRSCGQQNCAICRPDSTQPSPWMDPTQVQRWGSVGRMLMSFPCALSM